MAGGLVKYRHLSRNSSARQALLRGLVTQLIQHEHIVTTHAKAKEAQRLAEKLITMGKKDSESSRRQAEGILYEPTRFVPKLFGELKARYGERASGFTRVLRTEPRNKLDQAETSILELVDGPKDTRFMMTAKTVARDRLLGRRTTPVTAINVKKVTQFRGEAPFEDMVQLFMKRSKIDPDAEDEPIASTKGRQHWEPKVANFKMPQEKNTQKAAQASRVLTEEPADYEAEALRMAEAELQKAKDMAAELAADVQKSSGKDAEK